MYLNAIFGKAVFYVCYEIDQIKTRPKSVFLRYFSTDFNDKTQFETFGNLLKI